MHPDASLTASIHDVEDLRGQSEHLAAQRDRYVDLFQSLPGAYVVTDPYGSITKINPAALEMLRSPLLNIVGRPLEAFIALEHRRAFRDNIIDMIGRGGYGNNYFSSAIQHGSEEAQPVDCLVGGMTRSGRPVLGLCWLLRPAKGR